MPDGNLSGGVEGDSDLEDADETRTQKALDMLMRGEVISDTSLKSEGNLQPNNDTRSEPSPRQPSKFAARRQFANDVSNSSPRTGSKPSESSSPQPSPFRKPPSVIATPKMASEIHTATKAAVSAKTQPPSSAFSSMIVDSPSFPASGSFSSVIVDSPSFPQTAHSPDQVACPTALADQVRESSSLGRTPAASGNSQNPPGKVSRFKAARS